MNELMEAAQGYAAAGLKVFPLIPHGKRPATPNGFKAATSDRQQIESWWTQNSDYNIGIATGKASGGLVVIDLDVKPEQGIDGRETLREWERSNGSLNWETWLCITGSGGYHIYYQDFALWHNKTGLYEGVDVRGDGGYVVAPPSRHENGRCYEWEQEPFLYPLATVGDKEISFLLGTEKEGWETLPPAYEVPAEMQEGTRTNALVQLIGSMKAKGLTNEAIKAAVTQENAAKCRPPLTDKELERQVFPALARNWQATAPYDKGLKGPPVNLSTGLSQLAGVEEKKKEFLLPDYIPKGDIVLMAGDGGVGKTTVWCAIAAGVSAGKRCFLVEDSTEAIFHKFEPGKVLFFSAEDSVEHVLKRRLRKNGADLANISFMDITDERFKELLFGSEYLHRIIAENQPTLCIFDPIQAFIPPNLRMADRNAMRSCLNPLIALGKEYGVTFLIIVHTNKQSGVWGRKRIADSSDFWDISRSVLMLGVTQEPGILYLAQEKSSYGIRGLTALFKLGDERPEFVGYTTKGDKDFILDEYKHAQRARPELAEAKAAILEYLEDGEKEVKEIDAMAAAMSISKNALKNAKAELKKEGLIGYRSHTEGKNKGVKHYAFLLPVMKSTS